MPEDLLISGAKKLGIELTADQIENFSLYLRELLSWNKKFNLTRITAEEDIITKHFLDSLTLVKAVPLCSQSLIDVGTGAGFPGVPLKIVCEDLNVTLLDSVKKKVDFLNYMISLLNLKKIKTIWGRAEDVIKDLRETFDIAASRAVANLRELLEYTLPFVKVGGLFIAMKEEKVEDELDESDNALKILGGKVKEVYKIAVPETQIVRSLILVEKVSQTPSKYPRRAGIPKKRPL